MKKEFQIRTEYESDGREDIENFTSLTNATARYRELVERGIEDETDDVHFELIEVLEQDTVCPDVVETGDL